MDPAALAETIRHGRRPGFLVGEAQGREGDPASLLGRRKAGKAVFCSSGFRRALSGGRKGVR
eukprot:1186527-Prorocentrum_minimum.AAC.3